MSYKKNLCVYMSFNIKRHIYTSVISWYEIDKLNKEIGRLNVLAAESAGAVGSEEEDWTSGEDTRTAKGAINRKHYFLSSPPCVNPPKSYLLAAVPPLSCVSDTRDKIVIHKTVHFPLVLSSAPHSEQHFDCSLLSCSCSKCVSFKNSSGFCLVYADQTATCQKRAGCKCVSCRKNYALSGDKWDEVSASHSISRAQQPTVTPPPTLYESTAIHLISSSATFLDTPFGIAVRSPPHNDSVVYLSKGECHIAQQQTECILQHVDTILKFDTK